MGIHSYRRRRLSKIFSWFPVFRLSTNRLILSSFDLSGDLINNILLSADANNLNCFDNFDRFEAILQYRTHILHFFRKSAFHMKEIIDLELQFCEALSCNQFELKMFREFFFFLKVNFRILCGDKQIFIVIIIFREKQRVKSLCKFTSSKNKRRRRSSTSFTISAENVEMVGNRDAQPNSKLTLTINCLTVFHLILINPNNITIIIDAITLIQWGFSLWHGIIYVSMRVHFHKIYILICFVYTFWWMWLIKSDFSLVFFFVCHFSS